MIFIFVRIYNSLQQTMWLKKLIITQLVEEIFRIVWKPNIHHRTLSSASLIPVGGDKNLACIVTFSLFTASLKLFSSPRPSQAIHLFALAVSTEVPWHRNSVPSEARHMPLASHPACCDRPSNIWRNVHIMKLSCRFLWRRTEECLVSVQRIQSALMQCGVNCLGEVKNNKNIL